MSVEMVLNRGFVDGGFQTVVRVWSGEQIPAPHFLTSIKPQFHLGLLSRAKKAHKHKETHRTPPNSDPLLKFFMWGPLLLENKAEEATHIKNLGLHWGPLHSSCGYFFMCFFRFLFYLNLPLTAAIVL